MIPDQLKKRLLSTLPKDLILDLYDMSAAQAQSAFEMVRDHSGLVGRPAKELIGHARFRMQEKGFRDICLLHNGTPLEDDLLPGSKLKVFQPFMRFQGTGAGVIFGLATMSEKGKLPNKNRSRIAGVTLNYWLTPRLDLDGKGPKLGDIFVLFLIARDPRDAAKIQEVAVGVIDSAYESYVIYLSIEDFLAGYIAEPAPDAGLGGEENGDSKVNAPQKLVKLKSSMRPFVPPEVPNELPS